MKISERMLPFSDINWSGIIASEESPIEFCLRNDVPVYLRVDRDRQRVHYQYRLRKDLYKELVFERVEKFSLRDPKWEIDRRMLLGECTVVGFHDELIFLRLENYSLAEIAIASRSTVSHFSDEGFSIPRPFSVVGYAPHGQVIKEYGKIKTSVLERVDFDRAFLVDKERWESVPCIPPAGSSHAPEAFKISVEVGKKDLWFASVDIEALKRKAWEHHEVVSYPLEHRDRMPGIYWMFQAAYALNELKNLSKDGVAKWLADRAPDGTYSYKSIRTAEKFVWPTVNRAKGGKDRGDFDLEAFDGVADGKKYQFPFVSKGLSMILAIAEWWLELFQGGPDETRLPLAKKLDANRFEGHEVGHLVYLISGSQLTDEEVTSFDEYRKSIGKKVRPIVDRKPKNLRN